MALIYLFRKEDKIFIKDSVLMMNDPELRNDLFIIPLAIQKELINLLHSRSGALHLGINKTQIIAQQYLAFWNMTNVIAEVVGSCKQCKDGKKLENNRTPGLGSTSSQVNERIKRWSMDCVQMPPGHGGNKYLLTLLDMSTGWKHLL